MIARLWWKEMRTLWPAWPVLFGAGAALQWVLLASGAEGFRSGVLMPIALCWATIYAFVAASAAFAGERETGTLDLLDALPVDRRTLWLGKTTFVLASTFGLALIMIQLGYVGSTDALWRDPGKFAFLGHYGTLLFEAVAWGLFWSALLGNPMVAGALALICIGEVSYFASEEVEIEFVADSAIPARLVMATLVLAASAAAVVWRPLAGWSSPRFLGADVADRPADRRPPIRPRPASPTRVLMWKTKREGFSVWLGASAVGWGALVWLLLVDFRSIDAALPVALLGVGAALVAGVGVFGGETATGSQRFLLHLGVGPGPIWSRTIRAWGNGLAVTALIVLAMLSCRRPGNWSWPDLRWLRNLIPWFTQSHRFGPIPFVVAIADAFAVGTLSGMVFRRRITAGMIALIAWLAIAPLQVGLAVMGLLPPWALLLTPVALLVISRAWAGDWLDARPGPARWLRLAGYLAVPSVIFSAVFIANRAWGVPDPGPVRVAAPASPSGIVPPGSDTVATYRRLAVAILPADMMAGDGVGTKAVRYFAPGMWLDLEENRDLKERIYRATKMPPLRFADRPLVEARSTSDPTLDGMRRVAWLLDEHERGLLRRGNLAGAWEDILALYRMARQMTGAVSNSFATHNALTIDRQATMLALDWAAADKQTPDLLRKALADLRALPPFPTLGDVMKAEAPIVERTLDLSGAELEAAIRGPRDRSISIRAISETMLLYPSWERQRARRVCRAELKRLIAASADESKPLPDLNSNEWAEEIRRISPLAAQVMSYGWIAESLSLATAGRRGLVQVIALRSWNQAHDGTYPETLDALVPDLLDHLPRDPYTARPFGYLRSKGQTVVSLNLQTKDVRDVHEIKPGQWLLLSVGPDGRAAYGTAGIALDLPQFPDDLVFPLP